MDDIDTGIRTFEGMNKERKKEIGNTRNLNVSIFACKGMA